MIICKDLNPKDTISSVEEWFKNVLPQERQNNGRKGEVPWRRLSIGCIPFRRHFRIY